MKSWLNLKVALAVSIFVNLFLLTAAIGAGVVFGRHMHDLRDQMPREMKWDRHKGRDHAHDEKIFGMINEVAALGEADMQKAMALRGEALKVAQVDPFDKAKVLDLNAKARASENSAREKVETAIVEKLASQPKEVRAAILGRMMRPGFRHRTMRRVVMTCHSEGPKGDGRDCPPLPPVDEGRFMSQSSK